jgi:hypothetical protein
MGSRFFPKTIWCQAVIPTSVPAKTGVAIMDVYDRTIRMGRVIARPIKRCRQRLGLSVIGDGRKIGDV